MEFTLDQIAIASRRGVREIEFLIREIRKNTDDIPRSGRGRSTKLPFSHSVCLVVVSEIRRTAPVKFDFLWEICLSAINAGVVPGEILVIHTRPFTGNLVRTFVQWDEFDPSSINCAITIDINNILRNAKLDLIGQGRRDDI